MYPILLFGYERSGTTLMRRILSMCPGVEHMLVHENFHGLNNSVNLSDAREKLNKFYEIDGKTYQTDILSGQKIAYVDSHYVSGSLEKFKQFFGDNFYIVHIHRDPVSIINSQKRNFKKNIKECSIQYRNNYKKACSILENESVLNVQYNDLVTNPIETVKFIYDYLGFKNAENDLIGKITNNISHWYYKDKMMVGLRKKIVPSNESEVVLSDSDKELIKGIVNG